jgi:hypothetical protein
MRRGPTLCSVRHQLNFEYRDNIHEEKLCGPRIYRLDLDGCFRVFQGAAGVEWYLEIERIQEQHRCTEFLNYDFQGEYHYDNSTFRYSFRCDGKEYPGFAGVEQHKGLKSRPQLLLALSERSLHIAFSDGGQADYNYCLEAADSAQPAATPEGRAHWKLEPPRSGSERLFPLLFRVRPS